ncbi:MAG: hypothetical protein OEZ68_15995 [Gammaproteobacteria bacterium]|nr:hypothetical protein [Gammaproteobacteria bacterium]MDH5802304.1 hypothetical protein [Gammaproteobacteria bacterium]
MDERFVSILMVKCNETALDAAKNICRHSRQKGVDFATITQQFQSLLPKVKFKPVYNWVEAEQVIAKAYYVIQLKLLARKYFLEKELDAMFS